jgi:ATP-dependent DNA helicase Q5
MALTATATPKVSEDIMTTLSMKPPVATFKTPTFRSNLFYSVTFKDSLDNVYDDLKAFILKALKVKTAPEICQNHGSGIIYCRKKEECDDVAEGGFQGQGDDSFKVTVLLEVTS